MTFLYSLIGIPVGGIIGYGGARTKHDDSSVPLILIVILGAVGGSVGGANGGAVGSVVGGAVGGTIGYLAVERYESIRLSIT
jgi:hypothetical protein